MLHVAQGTGSDGNDGSEAHPFASISACANVAQAGDTCRVHAGTYRETVSPVNSGRANQPIRFEVADGECATVSGTEPLGAAFARDQGNIWVASLADTVEQLFSSGKLVWEAQWPNRTPELLFESPKAIAAQGTGVQTVNGASVTLLVDPNIPVGDWTGAQVFIMPGARWQSDTRPIKAYDANTHTITLDTTVGWAEKSIQPIPSNQYFLFGSKLALDAQDEWFWQNGNLYYDSADDPATHALEYKKRYYAFDVNQSYVEIVGFHVFGSAVRIKGNHDTVDSLTIEYSSHLRSFNAYYTLGDVNHIIGDDNTWKNSVIERSGSAGLTVEGSRNLVENNVITDVVYQATNHAGIDMADWTHPYSDNLFLYNTVTRSGRGGIFMFGSQNGRTLFNRVSDYALLTNDMGGIYAWGTDGQGAEIAYNDVGNSQTFYSNGIYLDDRTKHFVVHHNFVHDSLFFGACIKEENYYLNNTFADVGAPFIIDQDFQNGQWENTNLSRVENNVTDGTLLVRVGILPSIVTDYGYFEADVHPSSEWQHFTIPFASLYQPQWFAQTPLDLTSVTQIAFTPLTNGDFEFDLDNLRLEGNTPLMLDDFDSGSVNALGGSPWAGGSGDGTQSTSVALLLVDGGASATSKQYAAISGTLFQGWDSTKGISWGNMTESLAGANLGSYTGISFDMRGRLKNLAVNAINGNSPVQSHNDSCTFTSAAVPSCAIDRGTPIAGVTDGFAGTAPDLGAFESGNPAFAAGAVRSTDSNLCGKIADITAAIPAQAPSPWATATNQDAGRPDAGSSADAGTNTDAGTSAPKNAATVSGSGCGCRVVKQCTTRAEIIAMLALLLAAFARTRRTMPILP